MKKVLSYINNANNNFWCPEPYMTLEQKTYGNYGPCCRSKPLPYSTKDVNIEDHFNSKEMSALRAEMESDVIGETICKYCTKCLIHEKDNIESRRLQRIQQLKNEKDARFMQRLNQTVERSIAKKRLKLNEMAFYTLEFKFFGNLCNLECMMCHPRQSSSIAATWKKEGRWHGQTHLNVYKDYSTTQKQRFYDEIDMMLPHTKQIKFTGGEPLMNADILELIDYIIIKGYHKKIHLNLITNGTKLPKKFIDQIKQFEKVTIMVSVDGVWEVNDYQRTNSSFDVINDTINFLNKLPNVELLIGAALTALNVQDAERLYLYAKHKNIHVDLNSIVLTPKYLRPQILPDKFKTRYLKQLKNSAHKDKFTAIIAALEAKMDEGERKQECLRLLHHLEEKDKKKKTNFRKSIPSLAELNYDTI